MAIQTTNYHTNRSYFIESLGNALYKYNSIYRYVFLHVVHFDSRYLVIDKSSDFLVNFLVYVKLSLVTDSRLQDDLYTNQKQQ